MQMTATPLSRRPLKERPVVRLMPEAAPDMALAKGRAHEACGAARRSFALWLAAQMDGPVFWIAPAWTRDRLNPRGVAHIMDPSRLTLLSAPKEEDVLWCMEEALSSGAVPLVVAEPSEPPALTPVRRLHLAAERTSARPIGLLLSVGKGGAQGVESRWHMLPRAGTPDAPRWQLTRTRARTAPEKRWDLTWESGAARLAS